MNKLAKRIVPLLILCLAGAAYLLWHRPAVEQDDAPGISVVSDQTQVQQTTDRTWAEPLELEGVRNFYRVSPELYRGGQPTRKGFGNLKAMGIRTVVNLRKFHSDRSETNEHSLGYEHITFNPMHPEDKEVVEFLEILADHTNRPIFVHCFYGSDRTGMMCAIYRVAVQGWSKEEAIAEWTEGPFRFHKSCRGLVKYFREIDLEEFKRHQLEIFQSMQEMVVKKDRVTYQEYGKLPDISIDYAIMEKTVKGVVLPSEFGWSDIGTWKSLYEFLPKGDYNNVIDGDVIARNTENSFILGRDRLIATNYIKNMVVVETPDSIFVSDLDNSRDVKSIVENLQAGGRREYKQHTTVYQPWGNTTLLEQQNDYTVKRMTIYPGSSAELNQEALKLKHLSIISGAGRIESSSGKQRLHKGQTVLVSAQEKMKIENTGEESLCIIEIEMDAG